MRRFVSGLLLGVLLMAKTLGVEFAFPTQTLYLRQQATPTAGTTLTPDAAMELGRNEALRIVTQNLEPGVRPPPVRFG